MSERDVDLLARAQRGELGAANALLDVAIEQDDHELRMSVKRIQAQQDERVFFNEIDESLLIEIPAGPCILGKRKLAAMTPTYYMAQHPVTNRQFAEFIAQTGYWPQDHEMGEFLAHWPDGQPPEERLDHPVVYVSMLDAMQYCKWAGLMLPSEWMWEKAAAGPKGQTRPWGDVTASSRLATVLVEQTQHVETHRKIRSAYGCLDMIGNVSEWCVPGDDVEVDFISPGPEFFERDAHGALAFTQMCVRGSAYLRESVELMTCQHRRRLAAGRRNHWVGFRTAALVKGATSHADKWGELRSCCHESGIEGAVRLAKLDHVLATWPRGQDATHEVREYLRSHVVTWSPGQEERPDSYILATWLNGLKPQVFEALLEDGAKRPSYGLLERCVGHMRTLLESHDGFIIGHVAREAQGALVTWLRERARSQTGSIEPPNKSDVVSVGVTLPQVELAIPAIELEPTNGQLSMYMDWAGALEPWERWSVEETLMWLEALVQIARRHPKVKISLDLNVEPHIRHDLRELWSFYAQCRGVSES